MVVAARTLFCVTIAFVATACGVLLPPAEDTDGIEPEKEDPVTTKGTSMPAPEGADEDAGVPVDGTPAAPAEGGTPPQPSAGKYRVFVTSQVWSSDQIGGLAGADQKCTDLANAVTPLKNKKWAAWLSNGSTSALSRLAATPGPWLRIDSSKVAQDRGQLADKLLPLFTSIAVDEQGATHADSVWTGTKSDGSSASDVCGGWASTNGRGVIGKIDFTKPKWTLADDVDCDGGEGFWGTQGGASTKPRNRLYCFEID